MRLEALHFMRLLRPFRPRLIGSVMTGHVRKGSDIDIHVFAESPALVADLLQQEGCQFDVERKQIVKHGEERIFTHIHVYARFNLELTVYAEDKAHYVFRSSITGKAIERASIRELEELLEREYPGINLEGEMVEIDSARRSVSDLPHAAVAAGKRQAAGHASSRGGRSLSFAAGVRAGPRSPALRSGVSAGRPAARRRQGARSRPITCRRPWMPWTA